MLQHTAASRQIYDRTRFTKKLYEIARHKTALSMHGGIILIFR